ncbi:hypothetical protein GW17_00024177 [Ensete ventricosum]|nr:hypothetical protein GW17_00024177 [Ensete ventricosum]
MVRRTLFFDLDLGESLEPDMDDPADEPLYVPDDPLDSIRFLFDPLDESIVASWKPEVTESSVAEATEVLLPDSHTAVPSTARRPRSRPQPRAQHLDPVTSGPDGVGGARRGSCSLEPSSTVPADVGDARGRCRRPRWAREPLAAAHDPIARGENVGNGERICGHCGTRETPQWRSGPSGSSELCNACGIRYKSGRLFPEYRPSTTATSIDSSNYSNRHSTIVTIRQRKENERR